MSDSDSSCGVVISGFTGPQPSVKMVKRDRHREAPRHRENYPSSEDNGDSTAMMQQHASSSERKSKSDRKTETRDHSKSTTQGRRAERRATLDQYKPLPRNNSSQNFTIHKPLPRKSSLQNFAIPKSVEIDHSDRNEIIEINAADDNKSKRSSISRRKTLPPSEGSFISKQIDPHSGRTRRKTLPLPEESCISNQIDPHSGQNLDSISRGNPRAVQSSNRSEKNNNSKRSLQPRPSELIEGHRRPSSRDNIITRSSKTPRDPNIPSFLSIPANHEGADDHEGFEHDTYHRREDNMKDTSAQRTRDFSPSKNRPMESIGTTIIPSQTVAKSNPINHIEEHLSPLMIAASELDTMRNQLELFIQQMNTGHDSEDSVVEVNILSPPTPLPHSSFPEQLLKMVRLLPGNDQCCDCGKECLQENKTEETIRELTVGVDSAHIGGEGSSGTQQGEATTGGNKEILHSWASTSFGIILCNKCAYRHYNYAKKSDKKDRGGDTVKSLNGKNWTLPDVIAMLEGGNKSILQYFRDIGSEDKNQQVVPTSSVNQRSSLLGSTWAVVNLGNDTTEVKEKNPASKEDAYNCAFDVRYTSSVATSYRKLMSKRILSFGSKWQIWM